MTRIAIVTDAWHPQVNGVVRTMERTRDVLISRGHEVEVIGPDRFRSLPCPSYPEIRLAVFPGRKLARLLDEFAPHSIHITTEGPLGYAARRYCLKRGLAFTTCYHTRFPEYVRARARVPLALSYALLRRFHGKAAKVMVATPSIERELQARGFQNLARWSRGVDTSLFRPRNDRPDEFVTLPGPIWLYVGRVAVEKNIEAFLALDLPGSKVVVGDGPQRQQLAAQWPDVRFLGAREGDDLARCFAAGDVFVFPSRTDTFGLVILEALASGVPVAAYPVPGPMDVLADAPQNPPVGVLLEDLGEACRQALGLAGESCRAFAERFSWDASTRQFYENLAPIPRPA
ncbi:MAG: glycosyltransferase family 1 protein [Alphaproteobacteria bacterium]|nr:glycosyltransferase family 1 protein [Alphaproteobacteria bacterium]TAD89617.1 MAG: glycosyltransferase family 1 protein [Alphaproteobacteria bacterium]